MNSSMDFDGKYNPYAPPATDVGLPPAPVLDAGDQIPAQRGTRWWARLIDQLLVAACMAPAVAVALGTDNELGWLLSVLALGFLGYQWYLITKTGQTLGKRWLGSLSGIISGLLLVALGLYEIYV